MHLACVKLKVYCMSISHWKRRGLGNSILFIENGSWLKARAWCLGTRYPRSMIVTETALCGCQQTDIYVAGVCYIEGLRLCGHGDFRPEACILASAVQWLKPLNLNSNGHDTTRVSCCSSLHHIHVHVHVQPWFMPLHLHINTIPYVPVCICMCMYTCIVHTPVFLVAFYTSLALVHPPPPKNTHTHSLTGSHCSFNCKNFAST